MASNGPIDQQKWEFAPATESYAGEAPSFAGVIHVIDKELAWIAFENILKMYLNHVLFFAVNRCFNNVICTRKHNFFLKIYHIIVTLAQGLSLLALCNHLDMNTIINYNHTTITIMADNINH